jgi:hypothetical protein
MASELKKVYIIILNYNGWKHTLECVESILKTQYPCFTIVIIDNNSQDRSIEKITSWAIGEIQVFPESSDFEHLILPNAPKPLNLFVLKKNCIKQDYSGDNNKLVLIPNDKNTGFSNGNNLGIKFAINQKDCEYIWLLNNDTVVPSDSLNGLISAYENNTNEKIGIIGSKILFYKNPSIIQNIGINYVKSIAYAKEIGAYEKDNFQYDNEDLIVEAVAGTSMFVSKSFIIDVGLLGEEYFLYFEEVDWAIRSVRLGYTQKYTFKSIVYHKSGSSTGGDSYKNNTKSELSDYYHLRNKIIITRKFFPIFLFTLYPTYIISIINRIKRNQFKRILHILKIIFTT